MSNDSDETASTVATVFIGGAFGLENLLDPAIYESLVASGKIGIYVHGVGADQVVADGEMTQLADIWNPAGPGVFEAGENGFGLSQGTVTVRNDGSADARIAVGTIFTSADGHRYEVLAYVGQPGVTSPDQVGTTGYVSGGSDYSSAYYRIGAGQSLTLQVEAVSFGSDYDEAAGSITAIAGNPSLTVTGSSAMTGAYAWSDPSNAGLYTTVWRGTTLTDDFFSPNSANTYGTIGGLLKQWGMAPTEMNVNVPDSYAWTANDLTFWENYADNARANGVLNVAPIVSFNSLDVDYSQPFATAGYFQYVRDAALYSGGIAVDTPARTFVQDTENWFAANGENADIYVNFIEQEILWARQEGIRSSVIISPNTTGTSDAEEGDLLQLTKLMVARLEEDGALPSQFVIENYSGPDSNTASETDPNSLNAIAAFLGTVDLTPSASESGLEVAGRAPVDVTVDGIVATASIAAYGTATPYADAVVGAVHPPQLLTLTITLTGGGSLLDAAGGAVSTDGRTFSFTGDAADVQRALRGLAVANSSQAATAQTLAVTVSDASGTVSGTTAVALAASPTPPTIASVPQAATTGDTVAIAPFAAASLADPTGTGVTATVTLSDASAGSLDTSALRAALASGALSGLAESAAVGSLTLSGTAAEVQAALAALSFSPVRVAAGTFADERITLAVANAGGSATASEDIRISGSLAPRQPLFAGGISTSGTLAFGVSGHPFALATVSDDAAATVTVTVALSGAGTLSDAAGGTSSGNTWSFTGSSADAGTLLRDLTLTNDAPIGGTASLSVAIGDGVGSLSGGGTVSLAPEPAYVVGEGGWFAVIGDPRVTATIATGAGTGQHTVFGGAGGLDYTGGSTIMVFNGPASTGAAKVLSLGGNQVWAGSGHIDYTAGGHSQFILGDQAATSGSVAVHGGSVSDSEDFDVWGDTGTTQTIVSDGPGSSLVFGGTSALDFTGRNAVVIDNGIGTGAITVHSQGNDTVWAGAPQIDFYEGQGDDLLIGGAGAMVVHGAASGTGSTTFLGFAATGQLDFEGGSKDADLQLGSGRATVAAGSGNTTLAAGAGNLHLDLSKARNVDLSVDGTTAGGGDIYGYTPSVASVSIRDAVSTDVNGGNLVVTLGDGQALTFHGVASAAGIHFG